MKTYIKSHNNMPYSDFCFDAYIGFKEIENMEVILYEDINEVPSEKVYLVGTIEDSINYFNRMGIAIPNALNIPKELEQYIKREIKYMRMEEFIKTDNCPIFIKPAFETKSFPSGVLNRNSSKNILLGNVDKDMIVMTSSIVDIVSEYRIFISDRKIMGMKHYLGDYMIYPDNKFIDEITNVCYKLNMPISYSLDIGILSNGDNIFIEANDGWSIGNYNLDAHLYVRFLMRRWRQLLNI